MASTGLNFTFTFDAAVPDAVKTALQKATAYLQGEITDSVSIAIQISWEPNADPDIRGHSEMLFSGWTFNEVKAALLGDVTSADDNTALASLPTSFTDTLWLTFPQA